MNESNKPLELIQVFRGIAALFVLLVHAGPEYLNGVFNFGDSGVDFFFVLSGFIIFTAHYNDIGKREKIKSFLLKRFIRIYPVFWIVMAGLIPIYFLFPFVGFDYQRDPEMIIKSLLLIPQESPTVLLVAWTLVHEVKFYLMFCLLLLVIPLKFSKWLCGLWISATLVTFAGNINFDNVIIANLFHKHNLEFIVGCLAGFMAMRLNVSSRYQTGILYSGIILYIFSAINQDMKLIAVDRVLAYCIPSMLIVLGASLIDKQQSNNVPKFLLLLGNASFSIYIIHEPVLSFMNRVFMKLVSPYLGSFVSMTIQLVIALIIGVIFYQIIERPLLRVLRKALLRRANHKNKEISQVA